MEQFSSEGRPRRREYSKEFKAQLVSACAQPGASVGGVALAHGLHANMVHRWIRESGTVRAQPGVCADAEPSFISLPLTASVASTRDEQALAALPPSPPPPPLSQPPSAPVQLRLQRGELVVSLQCPLSQCGALLREVLR
jgi:transposase